MKKYILILFTMFFLVEYESYTWNPCDGDTCLSIFCGGGDCETPARQFFVKTIREVRELVDKNGTEHLVGMYRVDISNFDKTVTVKELKLVPDYDIQEK